MSTGGVKDGLNTAEKEIVSNLMKFWKSYGQQTLDQYKMQIEVWPSDREDHDISLSSVYDHFFQAQILVMTANKVESNMFVRLLSQESNYPLPAFEADNCVYHFGTIQNLNVIHLQPQNTSSFSEHEASRALTAAFKRFRPRLVVSLGVAFGIAPSEQHLGDVLVSKSICAYDAKNKRTDGRIKLYDDTFYKTDSRLMSGWMNPLSCPIFPRNTSGPTFRWYCDTLLSGGTVLSDAEERDKLLFAAEEKGYDVIGGEMEGFGVYYICQDEKVPCIVIKGICDWGALKNGWDHVWERFRKGRKSELIPDEDNDTVKDCIQALATENAFLALKYLLKYNKNVVLLEESEITPSTGTTMRRWFQKLRRFLRGREARPVLILGLILAIAMFATAIIYSSEYKTVLSTQIWMAIQIALLTGLCVFITCWGIYRARFLSRPENLMVEVAEIEISNLDFSLCFCAFQNASDIPLSGLKIAWLSKRQLTPVHISQKLDLPAQRKIFVNYRDIYIDKGEKSVAPSNTPIVPDTLQIEYDWFGRRIYHTINHAKVKSDGTLHYSEHIFKLKSGEYQELYHRRCRVKLTQAVSRQNQHPN